MHEQQNADDECPHPRIGFTLVEVLVVIAIVALLAAILTPVFLGAREKSRQSVCSAHLSQLYKAVTMYCEDYDGFRPMYGEGPDPVIIDGREVIRPDQTADLVRCLQPYGAVPEIWYCPDDPRRGNTRIFNRHPATSYHCQTALYTPPTGPPQPVQFPPLYRNPSQLRLFWDDIDSEPCPSGRGGDIFLYTHDHQFNAVYCDGHVRAVSTASQGLDGCN